MTVEWPQQRSVWRLQSTVHAARLTASRHRCLCLRGEFSSAEQASGASGAEYKKKIEPVHIHLRRWVVCAEECFECQSWRFVAMQVMIYRERSVGKSQRFYLMAEYDKFDACHDMHACRHYCICLYPECQIKSTYFKFTIIVSFYNFDIGACWVTVWKKVGFNGTMCQDAQICMSRRQCPARLKTLFKW